MCTFRSASCEHPGECAWRARPARERITQRKSLSVHLQVSHAGDHMLAAHQSHVFSLPWYFQAATAGPQLHPAINSRRKSEILINRKMMDTCLKVHPSGAWGAAVVWLQMNRTESVCCLAQRVVDCANLSPAQLSGWRRRCWLGHEFLRGVQASATGQRSAHRFQPGRRLLPFRRRRSCPRQIQGRLPQLQGDDPIPPPLSGGGSRHLEGGVQRYAGSWGGNGAGYDSTAGGRLAGY